MCLVFNFAEEVGTFDDENDNPSEGDVALSKVVESLLCCAWFRAFFFVYSRK